MDFLDYIPASHDHHLLELVDCFHNSWHFYI